jgi:AbrB family looped-hinge helix DNA binding protein
VYGDSISLRSQPVTSLRAVGVGLTNPFAQTTLVSKSENRRKKQMLVSVNRKAQVTIPKAVREKLNIQVGDVLELEVRGEELVLRPYASQVLVPRLVPADALAPLVGAISLGGGDAVEDAERLYDI